MKRYICTLITAMLLMCFMCCGCGAETLRPGDIVEFGLYEQDNDKSNGKEEIEWIVLDVKDGKCLLLSRYILDNRPYHRAFQGTNWQDCSLRKWLNSTFLDEAFMAKQRYICEIRVQNAGQGNGEYADVDCGPDTDDRVFLLSYYEVTEQYFTDDASRMCAPTDYAAAEGVYDANDKYTVEGRNAGNWFLRSNGRRQSEASVVMYDGSLFDGPVVADMTGMRPAMWVDIEAAGL